MYKDDTGKTVCVILMSTQALATGLHQGKEAPVHRCCREEAEGALLHFHGCGAEKQSEYYLNEQVHD